MRLPDRSLSRIRGCAASQPPLFSAGRAAGDAPIGAMKQGAPHLRELVRGDASGWQDLNLRPFDPHVMVRSKRSVLQALIEH